uniref:luc7-like protein 3 isoform X2 n=1 Tax=Ciona intestinalis TaxID=7719 RepID=UPI00006A7300|nr:luc7-like protein 3 isoform X2 [Ciona intestinalis]|eukprot:XP_009861643.1 luc7-like protein 3 isoform X2 [Ciona intestinalis]
MTALSAMLDELMGKNRNAAPDDKTSEIHFSDEEICKHFLCGFCPAELFTNTRSDLGTCNKVHDEKTRQAYQTSPRYLKCGYEEEFLRFLQQCWQDVERRIRRNHQRLQLSEEKNQKAQQGPSSGAENDEKISVLNERITGMLENIEKLGGEGEVEQAQSLMKLCDQLKEERETLQNQRGGIMDTFAVQEKQMEVCEVCGAFLIVGDAQTRVDDHLMGKQHMGYAKIKATIAELKDKLSKASFQNVPERKIDSRNGKRSSSRDRKDRRSRERRSRERGSRDHRDRSSRTSRDRDRRPSYRSRDDDKRSRDRKSSRDRDSRRRRSRERTDSRRSRDDRRDSDRHKRDRSRSRDKDRKRSRRSDSRDKKERKDRSKDRSKEKEKDNKETKKEEKPKEEVETTVEENVAMETVGEEKGDEGIGENGGKKEEERVEDEEEEKVGGDGSV